MKAISLWQPWSSLWCSPAKVHETRGWATSHRGWLLVHAAKKIVHDCGADLDEIVCDEFGNHWRMELPRGALIGAVRIIACEPTLGMAIDNDDDLLCGDFSPGRFAWRRKEYKRFDRPIPYRGSQGLFDVPDEVVAEAVREATEASNLTPARES